MEVLVPVIKEVDALLVGATLAGCELALRLRRAGRKVLLASEDSALGSDALGRLDPRACNGTTLLDGKESPSAGQARLDRILLEAGAEFLFGAIPLKPLLATGSKKLSGWIFFGRSGYFAIAAKAVVDATCDGILPFQMKLARRSSGISDCVVHWNLIGACKDISGIPDASMEISLQPMATEGTKVPFCQYQRVFRLRQNDLPARLRAYTTLRHDAISPQTIVGARWGTFDFANYAWENVETSLQLPFFRAGRADVPFLVQCTLPSVEHPGNFQAWESRPAPQQEELVWRTPYPRKASCHSVRLSLESLDATDYEVDLAVVGAGPAGTQAAIAAANKGRKVLLLERGETPWGGLDPLLNAGVETWLHCCPGAALMRQRTITGLLVLSSTGQSCLVRCKNVVDASGLAVVASAAGASIHFPQDPEPVTHGAVVAPRMTSNPFDSPEEIHYAGNDTMDATRARTILHLKRGDNYEESPQTVLHARPRILGEITILPHDLVLQHRYRDTIVMAKGHFPNAENARHPLLWLAALGGKSATAWIPLRALTPLRIEGLIVLGQAISAHKDVLQVCNNEETLRAEGIAAGLAVALSQSTGLSLRQLPLRDLQAELLAMGLLPPDIMDAQDDFHAPDACPMAEVFHRPDQARRILQARFESQKDLGTALLLAFLGDSSGRDTLAKALAETTSDTLLQKLCVLAEAFAIIGGNPNGMAGKLREMNTETPLQSLRVLTLFFQRWPSREPIPKLRALLEEILRQDLGKGGLQEVLDEGQPEKEILRLKALYLAMALLACSPGDETALQVIAIARNSWNLLVAQMAGMNRRNGF